MKPREGEGHCARILVVDDELGMREMLQLELGSQGYQVAVASNGKEALEQIRGQKFDLVISDLKMPQMDGMTLLGEIKGRDPKIEVIIATGYGTVESAVTAIKKGAYDFILKPFNLEELNMLIERVLEKKEFKTLVALYEASQAIFSTMELNKLLELMMDMSLTVLGADEGSIMLLDAKKKLTIAASRGLSDEIARQIHLDIGEGVAGLVAKEKRGRLLIGGLDKYPEFKGLSGSPRILSSIVCPLLNQSELLGVLNLNRTKTRENFTVANLQAASVFASQATLAIQNAKLYSTLQDAYQKLEKAQSELIQSEKLASIGRIVAGVAHELNNPLTSVIGYSQLISESRDLEEIQKQIPIIASQARRCSNIVKDLLLFSRCQKLDYERIDPCLLMEELLQGISLELKKRDIVIKKDFPSNPAMFEGDSRLLKQVFFNILTNAYQALEEVTRDRQIEIRIKKDEECLEFSFKDNGPGIPQESIHKIFDPFYTTKEVGKGTGLGLSLSYGIVREHGGAMYAESIEGKETVFAVRLPLKAREKLAAKSVERPTDSRLKLPDGARVLLVEDEEPIRGLIMAILNGGRYKIDVAGDGLAALAKMKRQDYGIILCDYRMPKLDGAEVYKQALKFNPTLVNRFLFISGSTEFMKNFDSFFKGNRLSCLLKPFTKNELISAINSLLETN